MAASSSAAVMPPAKSAPAALITPIIAGWNRAACSSPIGRQRVPCGAPATTRAGGPSTECAFKPESQTAWVLWRAETTLVAMNSAWANGQAWPSMAPQSSYSTSMNT